MCVGHHPKQLQVTGIVVKRFEFDRRRPYVVDQSAVALVFVDGPADTPQWSDVVEVLVRHGSARLESVTSQRTVEALTTSS